LRRRSIEDGAAFILIHVCTPLFSGERAQSPLTVTEHMAEYRSR